MLEGRNRLETLDSRFYYTLKWKSGTQSPDLGSLRTVFFNLLPELSPLFNGDH